MAAVVGEPDTVGAEHLPGVQPVLEADGTELITYPVFATSLQLDAGRWLPER